MKRTSLKRRKSKRLANYDAEFERMRPLVMAKAKDQCQAATFTFPYRKAGGILWSGCRDGYHAATHVHHRKYRSRAGTNAESNLIAVCAEAHEWIHAHPKESHLLGLSLKATESEAWR